MSKIKQNRGGFVGGKIIVPIDSVSIGNKWGRVAGEAGSRRGIKQLYGGSGA